MAEWTESPVDGPLVAGLVAAGQPPLMARLLALRGVSAGTLDDYLRPALKNLAQPEELPGAAEAAARILAHVRRRGKVVVFGDYDCDGICATAILVKTLEALSADVTPFLPERLSEGYGMTDASLGRMLRENPGVALVVTVDNGINSVDQVRTLKEKGVDVVVTDHHLPGEELPDCVVVNPKVAAPPFLDPLCGAGVAFLVANALVTSARKAGLYAGPPVGGPLLVLAGLATVTDIMPLVGQNRIIVSEALARFDSLAPLGLRELYLKAAQRGAPRHTAKEFGFLLGPRINAAGRLASGMEALELILADDREIAREAARIVDGRNVARKTVEQRMLEDALAGVVPGAPAQVIDLPDGHQGVAGIVAARVMERLSDTGRPVPVCVVVQGHGSARAPEGYNVRDALAASSAALERFGGHAAAGGFSVREGEADAFRRLFSAACAAQSASLPPAAAAAEFIDAWTVPSDFSLEFVEALSSLEPFGEGNPEPVFAMRRLMVSEARPIGADGRHLQVRFAARGCPTAVWWNRSDMADELRARSSVPFDVKFTAAVSEYGQRHVEFRIVSLRPSSP